MARLYDLDVFGDKRGHRMKHAQEKQSRFTRTKSAIDPFRNKLISLFKQSISCCLLAGLQPRKFMRIADFQDVFNEFVFFHQQIR